MAVRIPAEERLTNLIVALMATEVGLTKAQIFESVSGYRQRFESNGSHDALDKMFERDKDEIRGMGVPVETIGDHADPNDLREARYRIPKTDYALPEDLTFTPKELALLTLAGSVWREGSQSTSAQSALRKIRSLGITVDEPIIGFAPRLETTEPSFQPFQDAIEACRVVEFQYLKPGADSATLRRVKPLALVDMESRWHLFGIDVDADSERTFLLRRVSSAVTVTRKTFDPELKVGAGERAKAGLEAVLARNTALLEVTPGTEAALRLGRKSRQATQGVFVSYLDANIFADELASYGPEVRVVEPAQLKDLVVERLQRAAAKHAGEGSR